MNERGPPTPIDDEGPSFEGRHVSSISSIVEGAFTVSGFRVVTLDGHVLLRAPDADEYEVRVQREDDPDPHFMIIRGKGPLEISEVWRMVRRAERWLRRPRKVPHGEGD